MLVLTRRVDEEILINNGEIVVKILREQNGIITIGVKAPAHIDVDRKEIFLRKQENAQTRMHEETQKSLKEVGC